MESRCYTNFEVLSWEIFMSQCLFSRPSCAVNILWAILMTTNQMPDYKSHGLYKVLLVKTLTDHCRWHLNMALRLYDKFNNWQQFKQKLYVGLYCKKLLKHQNNCQAYCFYRNLHSPILKQKRLLQGVIAFIALDSNNCRPMCSHRYCNKYCNSHEIVHCF